MLLNHLFYIFGFFGVFLPSWKPQNRWSPLHHRLLLPPLVWIRVILRRLMIRCFYFIFFVFSPWWVRPSTDHTLRVCRRLQNACDKTERSLIHDQVGKHGFKMVFICPHLECEQSSCWYERLFLVDSWFLSSQKACLWIKLPLRRKQPQISEIDISCCVLGV